MNDRDYRNIYTQNENNAYMPDDFVEAKAPVKKERSGKAGFAAGVIAAALVVGMGSGIAGAVIGNTITNTKIEMPTQDKTNDDTVSKIIETLNTADTSAPKPLDYSKLEGTANDVILTTEELYEKVKNTIVLVYNYQNVYGYNEPVKAGSASGVVFTADGYIVTNAHVVAKAAKMTVVIPDYNDSSKTHEYEAEVVGSDTASDIAVMKIKRDEPLQYAVLGNSDAVRVGQDVCALGNPKSLVNSLTKGIVSGLGRDSKSKSTFGCSTIQIDAAINAGNSGGGLFDMYGNVIGIVDYKLISTTTSDDIENIGFAITINEAKPVINDLMLYGYVKNRPGLGINGEEITEYIAYTQGINHPGVYVTYISEDKPVAKSGLRIGDIIIAVNDTEITSIADIQTEVSKHSIGDTVELTVYRKNEIGNYKQTKLTAELSEIELN